ncbi:BCCT family transporter [Kytococcus schroeteri]|uniref:BCCT family transporter n=1 Tax=Kytococcus schroeteri TaxID=138300 RepID=UPI001141E27A|nr:BCCT family transporter [Kytococcus schroeteri]
MTFAPPGVSAEKQRRREHIKTASDVPEPDGSMDKGVFWPAALLAVGFVAATALFPDTVSETISKANTWVTGSFGWFYILSATALVFFAIWISVSRLGSTTLGPDDEEPEFSLVSWFAMLFSAGMGIGLMFFGVAEPLFHFATPRPEVAPPDLGEHGGAVAPETAEAAREAMTTTFLHWGLHPWAVYAVMGLGIAYAIHRRNRPVSVRWALEPLLGDKVKGSAGDLIDVVAIIGTLFGVATSLGLGVAQIAAGMEHLGLVDDADDKALQVGIIAVVTALATLSVASGIGKGIRYLSNLNLGLAVLLLFCVLFLGPTLFIMRDFVFSIGQYLNGFFHLSTLTMPFRGEATDTWLGSWTLFYWGWWISWSPFVGIFIARISRGRTVSEFMAGVLLVPALLSFFWFSVMGGTALHREIFGAGGLIGKEGAVDTNTALFQMLEALPGGAILAGIALLMVVIFFVTSSDSGSFVMDMLATGGSATPPVWSRVFWSVATGAIAAILILSTAVPADALTALQTLSILSALPVVFLLMAIAWAVTRALSAEYHRDRRLEHQLLHEALVRDSVEATVETLASGEPRPRTEASLVGRGGPRRVTREDRGDGATGA